MTTLISCTIKQHIENVLFYSVIDKFLKENDFDLEVESSFLTLINKKTDEYWSVNTKSAAAWETCKPPLSHLKNLCSELGGYLVSEKIDDGVSGVRILVFVRLTHARRRCILLHGKATDTFLIWEPLRFTNAIQRP